MISDGAIQEVIKNCLFGLGIKMINLSLGELKTVAKIKKVKDCKGKSKDELIKILSKPKPKINFLNWKLKRLEKNLTN